MSVYFDSRRQRWRVRWREDGRQRSNRFASAAEGVAYDEQRQPATEPTPPEPRPDTSSTGDAIYAHARKAGQRYRFVFRSVH